jgi:hypothetical protein
MIEQKESEFSMLSDTTYSRCRIVLVGTRRDGGKRFWCLQHRADATAKYGKRARKCRYADVPPISPVDKLRIDPTSYHGGIALWGAVPPIYDTTDQPLERGVHVHARPYPQADKVIDQTYRSVEVVINNNGQTIEVSELDAIYFMVSSVFGYAMRFVECTHCQFPHLDKDWFSIHDHRTHLCAGCGRLFKDEVRGIGNPAVRIRELFHNGHRVNEAKESLSIMQKDYPGGIQIWGSNPALLWTAEKNEEAGIHIHAFDQDGKTAVDETFANVTIDNIALNPALVRILMAQSGLPHIVGRVMSIQCEQCRKQHFDEGELAFTPHDDHFCCSCGAKLRGEGRYRKTIGNPMWATLADLSNFAVREPQRHESYLLTETL